MKPATPLNPTQQDYARRILRVLLHIQRHLDEPLALDELAEMAHFSRFHFHRVFRGMVGEPVKEHVRRLRLERAARQLETTSEAVVQIALGAGYEAHAAFTRAFRARFGVSPSEYREGRREAREPRSGVPLTGAGEQLRFQTLFQEASAMDARIESRDPLRVAFLRHTGPYEEAGATWGQLCAFAAPRGLLGPDAVMFGASYDDPEVTPKDKIRYDACLVVPESFEPEGPVGVQEIRGGDYAVTMLKGPYSGLSALYGQLLGQWLPAQGREPEPDAPFLEFCKNDPNETPPEQLETEVCVPLR
ncbi:MAG: AraC family transcriptional regulator [Planctomycetota bacterium]|nr:MAG: AraC family transcriptional regulator [Planctomycetota bacterium]